MPPAHHSHGGSPRAAWGSRSAGADPAGFRPSLAQRRGNLGDPHRRRGRHSRITTPHGSRSQSILGAPPLVRGGPKGEASTSSSPSINRCRRATTLFLRSRNGDRRLVDSQPDEHAILHMVSPPFLRLGTSQSGATLEWRMPWERPLTQSAHCPIMGSKAF